MIKQFLTMYFPSCVPVSVWVHIPHVDLLQTVPTLNGDSYVFVILRYFRIRLSHYCWYTTMYDTEEGCHIVK
jgi:hypothetical protein